MSTNPFQPGAGSYPPVLAGREAEQARLASLVESLADWRPGRPLQAIHVIQAPRGMGKTVLLQALERHVAGDYAWAHVTVLRTPASNLLAVVARGRGAGRTRSGTDQAMRHGERLGGSHRG